MTNVTKGRIIKGAALVIDVAAPLGATFSQFPIWVETSANATVSGLFLVCAMLSCIPFMKQIKMWLKSPSAWVMWCVLAVLVIALQSIIDQLAIICIVGAIGNLIGAALSKFGDIVGRNGETEETKETEESNQ